MARRTHVLSFLIRSLKPLVWPSLILVLATALGACGGNGLRPEPLPYTSTGPIAAASDGQLRVTLDALIVRDGPGSWAHNADWDEYRLTVENLAEAPVLLDRVLVIDSLGLPASGEVSRRDLVRASRDSLRRHDDAGLDVRAGAGGGAMLGAGAAVTALGIGTVSAAGTGALISGGAASPRHLLLSYRSDGLTRHLVVDTSSALGDLHIDDIAEEL